jgi:hypothetical protein
MRQTRFKPHRRKKRHTADKTNELAKKLAEALDARHPLLQAPPSLVDLLGTEDDECVYCSVRGLLKTNIDELVPPTRGGTMRDCNRVPSCVSCNSSKSNRVGEELDLWLVTRGTHDGCKRFKCDRDKYIGAERAATISGYVHAHRESLAFVGAAADEFERRFVRIVGHQVEFEAKVSCEVDGC